MNAVRSRRYAVCSRLLLVILLAAFCLLPVFMHATAEARVYIDITSPGFRQIPIAIYELSGAPAGAEISGIIKDDLQFSGVFSYVDRDAYIETSLPVFDPRNWSPLGVEIVVKGSVTTEGDQVSATIYLYDVVEGKKVFQKEYRAVRKQLRPLAHAISNDIYKAVTGEDGVFRSRIAFIGEKGGKKNIYIADWDGKRLINTGVGGDLILAPHWSRDGKRLIYSAARGRQWFIFLLDFKEKKERLLVRSRGTNIAGDFLPDGSGFLFSSSKAGTPDIYLFDLRTSRQKRLTRWRGIEVSPSVSPDGKKVAFVSDHGGSPQVYIMNINGSDVRRVTFTGNYNTSPVWSPRGDRIAYSGRIYGKNQIFIVSPDGADPLQLTERGNNEEPSFSPDGRFITFTSDRDGRKGVYVMRANGEAQKRITAKDMRAFGPRWSPKKIF
ncbi:MAG: protein TolB [bacterium]|nr:MAG: protein TolB [bacterium]